VGRGDRGKTAAQGIALSPIARPGSEGERRGEASTTPRRGRRFPAGEGTRISRIPGRAHRRAARETGAPGVTAARADRGARTRQRIQPRTRSSDVPPAHNAVATTMPITAAAIAPKTPSAPDAVTSVHAAKPPATPQTAMPRILPTTEPRWLKRMAIPLGEIATECTWSPPRVQPGSERCDFRSRRIMVSAARQASAPVRRPAPLCAVRRSLAASARTPARKCSRSRAA
jgi:hypothetical protein